MLVCGYPISKAISRLEFEARRSFLIQIGFSIAP
jgi:hypothetical protein